MLARSPRCMQACCASRRWTSSALSSTSSRSRLPRSPPSLPLPPPTSPYLDSYEVQVVVRTLSSPKPRALKLRADTWRALHVWVNGLTLMSKLARNGFFAQRAASANGDGASS